MQKQVDALPFNLLKHLKIIPDQQLIHTNQDCCQICLYDIDEYDMKIALLFVCCGKKLCRNCRPTLGLSSCPMCREPQPATDNEGLYLIQKNAISGHAWARYSLAKFYDSSEPDSDPFIQKNDTEAFSLNLLSAEKGHRIAQYFMGLAYYHGNGVEKSVQDAIYWFTLAANQGEHLQNYLACMITEGELHRSESDAVILFQNSAEKGHRDAQHNLATSYHDTTNPDHEKALFWYNKAALQNHHGSQHNISVILFQLKQDIPTAMYWLRMSAKCKNCALAESIELLAKMETDISLKCSSCSQILKVKGKSVQDASRYIIAAEIVGSRIGKRSIKRNA